MYCYFSQPAAVAISIEDGYCRKQDVQIQVGLLAHQYNGLQFPVIESADPAKHANLIHDKYQVLNGSRRYKKVMRNNRYLNRMLNRR